MEPLTIELQDIADAIAIGQEAPHRLIAETHILAGGVVNVTRNGAPIGQATTVDELNDLLI